MQCGGSQAGWLAGSHPNDQVHDGLHTRQGHHVRAVEQVQPVTQGGCGAAVVHVGTCGCSCVQEGVVVVASPGAVVMARRTVEQVYRIMQ